MQDQKSVPDPYLPIGETPVAGREIFRIYAWTNLGTRVCIGTRPTRAAAEEYAREISGHLPRATWRRGDDGALAVSIEATPIAHIPAEAIKKQ